MNSEFRLIEASPDLGWLRDSKGAQDLNYAEQFGLVEMFFGVIKKIVFEKTKCVLGDSWKDKIVWSDGEVSLCADDKKIHEVAKGWSMYIAVTGQIICNYRSDDEDEKFYFVENN